MIFTLDLVIGRCLMLDWSGSFGRLSSFNTPDKRLKLRLRRCSRDLYCPRGLDPRLIDKLPDRPGIFFLHGPHDQILQIGHASNLRLHLLNYFRIDRNSAKALDLALRICNITFRVSEGIIGARLQSAILSKTLTPKKGNLEQNFYSWLFVPEDYPSLKLINRSNEADQRRANSFGLFLSERRAKNAM